MKFYKVDVTKIGSYIEHPDVGHKNYKNAGYNLDLTQCVWIAKEGIDMNADGVVEITIDEAQNLTEQWQIEKNNDQIDG